MNRPLFTILYIIITIICPVKPLEKEFTVKKGLFKYFNVQDCMQLNLSTCFANHPLTPYGLIYLPKSPAEIPYPGCSDECPFCDFLCHPDIGMSPIWRIDENEAIIVEVEYIPHMKYSTFTMYLWGRYHNTIYFNQNTPHYLQCKRKEGYCKHFASLGDSIPVHSPTKVIITPSVTIYTKLFNHFKDPSVKLMALPGSTLKLGVEDSTRDLFSFVHRMAFVDNQTMVDKHVEHPQITVTRVTLNASIDNVLFDRAVLKQRKTGKKESLPTITHTTLLEGLETLKTKIVETYKPLRYKQSEMTAAIFDSGYDCIDNQYECNGDVRDTLYTLPKSFLKDDYLCSFNTILSHKYIRILFLIIVYMCCRCSYKLLTMVLLLSSLFHSLYIYPCSKPSVLQTTKHTRDFFILTGVNHRQTDYCLYHSISIYEKDKRIGVKVITDDLFYNSSFQYTPELSNYLYAYKFKYKCKDEPYCSETETNKIFFIERMYVHPQTGIGAHRSEIINSTLFHFSPIF